MNQGIYIHSLEKRVEVFLIDTICYMSASIQLFVGASMYNFLLSENSVYSELLEKQFTCST